jgi:hypothetical protein
MNLLICFLLFRSPKNYVSVCFFLISVISCSFVGKVLYLLFLTRHDFVSVYFVIILF